MKRGFILFIFMAGMAYSDTFEVTTLTDYESHADSVSLRMAIDSCNARSGADTIKFNIQYYTEEPIIEIDPNLGCLTLLDDATTIIGINQPDNAHIIIEGSNFNTPDSPFTIFYIDADFCSIKGFKMYFPSDISTMQIPTIIDIAGSYNIIGGENSNDMNQICGVPGGDGILIEALASYNEIKGNIIGFLYEDPQIDLLKPISGYGIVVQGNYNLIGDTINQNGKNVINNCYAGGIKIEGTGSSGKHNIISNNFIGTNVNGSNTIEGANIGKGIYLMQADSNIIGKTSDITLPNVIAGITEGEEGNAIRLEQSSYNKIRGNIIGLNQERSAVLPTNQENPAILITDGSNYNEIGDPNPDDDFNSGFANYICGFRDGIWLGEGDNSGTPPEPCEYTKICNNFIGVYDDSSNTAAGSANTGIRINNHSYATEIKHNLIGHNGYCGIHLSRVDSTLIEDNFIGVWKDTSYDMGNKWYGILVDTSVNNIVIIRGNFIHYNGHSPEGSLLPGVGIDTLPETGCVFITETSFKQNGGIAIDLKNNGVGNPSSGPNYGIQSPIIKSISGDTARVKSLPGYVVEIYEVEPEPDPTGYGEGYKYLGNDTTGTDSIAIIVLTNPFENGKYYCALHYHPDTLASSEFSENYFIYNWDEDVSDDVEESDPSEEGAYNDKRNDGKSNSYASAGTGILEFWTLHGHPGLMETSPSGRKACMKLLGELSKIDFRGVQPFNGYVGLMEYINSKIPSNPLKVNHFDKSAAKHTTLFNMFVPEDTLKRQMIMLWIDEVSQEGISRHEATPKAITILAMSDSTIGTLENGINLYPIKILDVDGKKRVMFIDEAGNLYTKDQSSNFRLKYIPEKVTTVGINSPFLVSPSLDGVAHYSPPPSINTWTPGGIPVCDVPQIQDYMEISPDKQGGAIVVWEDQRTGTGYPMDIYGQRLDGEGNKLWSTNGVLLVSNTYDQWRPVIVPTNDGGAIVIFRDNRLNQTYSDIYAQRISPTGTLLWGEEGIIVCSAQNDQFNVQAVSDGKNGAYIVWTDMRAGNADIYAQHIDSTGLSLWTAHGVPVCIESGNQIHPFISSVDTFLYIGWEDGRTSYDKTDIYIQRLNPEDGSPELTTNGVKVSSGSSWEQLPKGIVDSNGNLIIAWEEYSNTTYLDIKSAKVTPSGSIEWNTTVVSEGSDQVSPLLLKHSEGALCIWQDRRYGNWDIYFQVIKNDGSLSYDPAGKVISGVASDQWLSDATTSQDNSDFNVVWFETRNQNDYDIYGQWIRTDGSFAWSSNGLAICDVEQNQKKPKVKFVDENNVMIVWKDTRNNDLDIYGYLTSEQGVDRERESQRISIEGPSISSIENAQYIIYNPYKDKKVILNIYDISGRRIYSKEVKEGKSVLNLKEIDINSGIYFISMDRGEERINLKIIIVK